MSTDGDDLGFSKVNRERQLAQASKGQLREMATELRNMRVVDVSGGADIQNLGFSGPSVSIWSAHMI